jgi:hypothetical protein
MNRRAFLGAMSVLAAAPLAALGVKFAPIDISRATYSYWQSRPSDASRQAYENLRAVMRMIHAECVARV